MSTVLVVEDDQKLREVPRCSLEHSGPSVLSTASGAEELAVAAAGDVNLVVLDLRLPNICGEEVVRKIRATSQIPILTLTGMGQPQDRIRGFELGADDYVTKLFSLGRWGVGVEAILRRGTHRRVLETRCPRSARVFW